VFLLLSTAVVEKASRFSVTVFKTVFATQTVSDVTCHVTKFYNMIGPHCTVWSNHVLYTLGNKYNVHVFKSALLKIRLPH